MPDATLLRAVVGALPVRVALRCSVPAPAQSLVDHVLRRIAAQDPSSKANSGNGARSNAADDGFEYLTQLNNNSASATARGSTPSTVKVGSGNSVQIPRSLPSSVSVRGLARFVLSQDSEVFLSLFGLQDVQRSAPKLVVDSWRLVSSLPLHRTLVTRTIALSERWASHFDPCSAPQLCYQVRIARALFERARPASAALGGGKLPALESDAVRRGKEDWRRRFLIRGFYAHLYASIFVSGLRPNDSKADAHANPTLCALRYTALGAVADLLLASPVFLAQHVALKGFGDNKIHTITPSNDGTLSIAFELLARREAIDKNSDAIEARFASTAVQAASVLAEVLGCPPPAATAAAALATADSAASMLARPGFAATAELGVNIRDAVVTPVRAMLRMVAFCSTTLGIRAPAPLEPPAALLPPGALSGADVEDEAAGTAGDTLRAARALAFASYATLDVGGKRSGDDAEAVAAAEADTADIATEGGVRCELPTLPAPAAPAPLTQLSVLAPIARWCGMSVGDAATAGRSSSRGPAQQIPAPSGRGGGGANKAAAAAAAAAAAEAAAADAAASGAGSVTQLVPAAFAEWLVDHATQTRHQAQTMVRLFAAATAPFPRALAAAVGCCPRSEAALVAAATANYGNHHHHGGHGATAAAEIAAAAVRGARIERLTAAAVRRAALEALVAMTRAYHAVFSLTLAGDSSDERPVMYCTQPRVAAVTTVASQGAGGVVLTEGADPLAKLASETAPPDVLFNTTLALYLPGMAAAAVPAVAALATAQAQGAPVRLGAGDGVISTVLATAAALPLPGSAADCLANVPGGFSPAQRRALAACLDRADAAAVLGDYLSALSALVAESAAATEASAQRSNSFQLPIVFATPLGLPVHAAPAVLVAAAEAPGLVAVSEATPQTQLLDLLSALQLTFSAPAANAAALNAVAAQQSAGSAPFAALAARAAEGEGEASASASLVLAVAAVLDAAAATVAQSDVGSLLLSLPAACDLVAAATARWVLGAAVIAPQLPIGAPYLQSVAADSDRSCDWAVAPGPARARALAALATLLGLAPSSSSSSPSRTANASGSYGSAVTVHSSAAMLAAAASPAQVLAAAGQTASGRTVSPLLGAVMRAVGGWITADRAAETVATVANTAGITASTKLIDAVSAKARGDSNSSLSRSLGGIAVQTVAVATNATFLPQGVIMPGGGASGGSINTTSGGDSQSQDPALVALNPDVWGVDIININKSHGASSAHSESLAVTAPRGLVNLGSTCYLNSMLQQLLHSRSFLRVLFGYDARHVITGRALEYRISSASAAAPAPLALPPATELPVVPAALIANTLLFQLQALALNVALSPVTAVTAYGVLAALAYADDATHVEREQEWHWERWAALRGDPSMSDASTIPLPKRNVNFSAQQDVTEIYAKLLAQLSDELSHADLAMRHAFGNDERLSPAATAAQAAAAVADVWAGGQYAAAGTGRARERAGLVKACLGNGLVREMSCGLQRRLVPAQCRHVRSKDEGAQWMVSLETTPALAGSEATAAAAARIAAATGAGAAAAASAATAAGANTVRAAAAAAAAANTPDSIVTCLSAFCSQSMLSGENALSCPACQRLTNAQAASAASAAISTKADTLSEYQLSRLPRSLLALHLKRWEYNMAMKSSLKVSTWTRLPDVLSANCASGAESDAMSGGAHRLHWTEGRAAAGNSVGGVGRRRVGRGRVASYSDYTPNGNDCGCRGHALSGVLVHVGSAGAGHYFSFVRDRGALSLLTGTVDGAAPGAGSGAGAGCGGGGTGASGERWWRCDDAAVTPLDRAALSAESFGILPSLTAGDIAVPSGTPSAYMAMYERQHEPNCPQRCGSAAMGESGPITVPAYLHQLQARLHAARRSLARLSLTTDPAMRAFVLAAVATAATTVAASGGGSPTSSFSLSAAQTPAHSNNLDGLDSAAPALAMSATAFEGVAAAVNYTVHVLARSPLALLPQANERESVFSAWADLCRGMLAALPLPAALIISPSTNGAPQQQQQQPQQPSPAARLRQSLPALFSPHFLAYAATTAPPAVMSEIVSLSRALAGSLLVAPAAVCNAPDVRRFTAASCLQFALQNSPATAASRDYNSPAVSAAANEGQQIAAMLACVVAWVDAWLGFLALYAHHTSGAGNADSVSTGASPTAAAAATVETLTPLLPLPLRFAESATGAATQVTVGLASPVAALLHLLLAPPQPPVPVSGAAVALAAGGFAAGGFANAGEGGCLSPVAVLLATLVARGAASVGLALLSSFTRSSAFLATHPDSAAVAAATLLPDGYSLAQTLAWDPLTAPLQSAALLHDVLTAPLRPAVVSGAAWDSAHAREAPLPAWLRRALRQSPSSRLATIKNGLRLAMNGSVRNPPPVLCAMAAAATANSSEFVHVQASGGGAGSAESGVETVEFAQQQHVATLLMLANAAAATAAAAAVTATTGALMAVSSSVHSLYAPAIALLAANVPAGAGASVDAAMNVPFGPTLVSALAPLASYKALTTLALAAVPATVSISSYASLNAYRAATDQTAATRALLASSTLSTGEGGLALPPAVTVTGVLRASTATLLATAAAEATAVVISCAAAAAGPVPSAQSPNAGGGGRLVMLASGSACALSQAAWGLARTVGALAALANSAHSSGALPLPFVPAMPAQMLAFAPAVALAAAAASAVTPNHGNGTGTAFAAVSFAVAAAEAASATAAASGATASAHALSAAAATVADGLWGAVATALCGDHGSAAASLVASLALRMTRLASLSPTAAVAAGTAGTADAAAPAALLLGGVALPGGAALAAAAARAAAVAAGPTTVMTRALEATGAGAERGLAKTVTVRELQPTHVAVAAAKNAARQVMLALEQTPNDVVYVHTEAGAVAGPAGGGGGGKQQLMQTEALTEPLSNVWGRIADTH